VGAGQYQSRRPLRLAVLKAEVSCNARRDRFNIQNPSSRLVSYERAGTATTLSCPVLSCVQCEARSSSVTHVLFQGVFLKKRGG
jgi:hypothetical protein